MTNKILSKLDARRIARMVADTLTATDSAIQVIELHVGKGTETKTFFWYRATETIEIIDEYKQLEFYTDITSFVFSYDILE